MININAGTVIYSIQPEFDAIGRSSPPVSNRNHVQAAILGRGFTPLIFGEVVVVQQIHPWLALGVVAAGTHS